MRRSPAKNTYLCGNTFIMKPEESSIQSPTKKGTDELIEKSRMLSDRPKATSDRLDQLKEKSNQFSEEKPEN